MRLEASDMMDFFIVLSLLLGTGASGAVAFIMFLYAVMQREQRDARNRRLPMDDDRHQARPIVAAATAPAE
jgi:hypothetical protein